ncbi:MAG: hypothetical protein KBB75_00895 [Candidatus Pacebacteria bacterium]|jgi:predicted phosphoribosyltransferase|nr:hypothetical protein [Candidatus Paceibacterota bacterium]
MKFLSKIFPKKNTTLREKITQEIIDSAYKNRYKEIESLRKYDRGEKTIAPINLKTVVRSV